MNIESILTPERTLCGASGSSKKKLLELIAQFISDDIKSLDADTLFQQLVARERLGSTGLGGGIAIPHCRLPNCASVVGSLISLREGVDFEALDDQPVDLLFVLLVPEEANEEHLKTLAALAERFSQPTFCQALRDANSADALYQAAIS